MLSQEHCDLRQLSVGELQQSHQTPRCHSRSVQLTLKIPPFRLYYSCPLDLGDVWSAVSMHSIFLVWWL
jgi:hypothetical protein